MTNVARLQTTADLSASQTAGAASSLLPTGTVLAYAGTSAPSGWLTCDGTAVSRSTYAALYTAIGVAHGYGDNSTTFNLPDYRGRFVRGGDAMFGGSAASRDPDKAGRTAANTGGNTGNAVGSVQGDVMQGHYHSYQTRYGGSIGNDSYIAGLASPTSVSGTARAEIYGPSNDGTTGAPRTSSETRPLNAYVNYIIKI